MGNVSTIASRVAYFVRVDSATASFGGFTDGSAPKGAIVMPLTAALNVLDIAARGQNGRAADAVIGTIVPMAAITTSGKRHYQAKSAKAVRAYRDELNAKVKADKKALKAFTAAAKSIGF
jgi:hypothetical protein